MRNLTLLTAALSITACVRNQGDDSQTAEVAADSTTSTDDEASLLSGLMDGANSALAAVTADQAAGAIVARAQQRYNPSGCVVATQNGTTVTLVFSNCTGPRGLRTLNGTLVLAVSAGANGAIVIDASATDFHVGLSTLDIASTATYTGSGTSQSLAVSTKSTGTGALGFAIEHDGDYTVTWDASCVSIDGAWSTERGDLARSTTANISRCVGMCPIGTVTRNTLRDKTITLTFDGSATASWAVTGGRSGTFPLSCGM